MCYNRSVPRERERKTSKSFSRKFKKTLDKLLQVCYNKNVPRERKSKEVEKKSQKTSKKVLTNRPKCGIIKIVKGR